MKYTHSRVEIAKELTTKVFADNDFELRRIVKSLLEQTEDKKVTHKITDFGNGYSLAEGGIAPKPSEPKIEPFVYHEGAVCDYKTMTCYWKEGQVLLADKINEIINLLNSESK